MEILVRSIVMYITIFGCQIVKSWFVGEVSPSAIDVILSIVLGWWLGGKILKRL